MGEGIPYITSARRSIWLHHRDLHQVTGGVWKRGGVLGRKPQTWLWSLQPAVCWGNLMLLLSFCSVIVLPPWGDAGSDTTSKMLRVWDEVKTPSEPSLKQGAEETASSLQRKGYFGAADSEPASLLHSIIILAPRRTHTRSQGCTVTPACGNKAMQGHGVFRGARHPPDPAIIALPSAPCHGAVLGPPAGH